MATDASAGLIADGASTRLPSHLLVKLPLTGWADWQNGGASEPERAPGRQASKLSFLDSLCSTRRACQSGRQREEGGEDWRHWKRRDIEGLKGAEFKSRAIKQKHENYWRRDRKQEITESNSNNDQWSIARKKKQRKIVLAKEHIYKWVHTGRRRLQELSEARKRRSGRLSKWK